jgi:hypothetical protein
MVDSMDHVWKDKSQVLLTTAAKSGHVKITQLLFKTGARSQSWTQSLVESYYNTFIEAAETRHVDIVGLFP